jgi:glycolate oxidase iron-sulfur subunit
MDDLEVCMRCGFCRASCSVFEETLAESGSARGKIAIIQAMLKGDIAPSERIAKRVFECTLCGRCSQSCPAGVDTTKIFIEARKELIKKYLSLRKRAALKILESPKALSLVGQAAPLMPKSVLYSERSGHIKTRLTPTKPRMRVGFFSGCLLNNFLPGLRDSAISVLAQNNVEVVLLKEKCCGLPLYFSGEVERAENLARENLSVISDLDVDFVVTACPSCSKGLKKYPDILSGEHHEAALRLSESTFEICEFLARYGYSKNLGEIKKDITYHESCHMNHGSGKFNPRELISSISGIKIREMERPDSCCGFGGLFSIDNPTLSGKINKSKIEDIMVTGAKEVVTPCPGCIMFIQRSLFKEGSGIKVRHPVEILFEAYNKAYQNTHIVELG